MLWYGYIFYLIFIIFTTVLLSFWSRTLLMYSLFQINSTGWVYKNVLSFLIFVIFLSLIFLYQSFVNTSNFILNEYSLNIMFFHSYTNNIISISESSPSSSVNVYCYPFMYVFFFVTFLSIFFCLSYNYNEFVVFIFYCFVILIAGFILFFTDSLAVFFFAYEMLLIPSFFILYKYAKTRRCIEAAYLMFFWTQFGAFFLIFSFLYLFFITKSTSFYIISLYNFSSFEVNFLFICWIIGFGVKLPIWPFYGWLPKAHVEASTNFSIFLSGVLVKFAFFGLVKCLFTVQLEPTFIYIYPLLFVGITDSVFKLFYQIDLKKLIAYSTVVEMHWLTICVISGQSCLMMSAYCMLISHALLSTNAFLLVDSINRRFKTRLITELSGINFLCPKLFLFCLLNCLIFLGFPGSIFFISEFLFFTFFFDLFPILCIFLLILLYFFAPTFFFRSWVNALFGLSLHVNRSVPIDLNLKEFCSYLAIVILMFWFGFTWQLWLL